MLTRIAVTSCIAAIGLAAPTHAADLDDIIYAPDLPVTQPVEIGTGWYLRGDLGYSARTRGEATSYSVFSAVPPTYTATNFDSSSLDNHWSGAIGMGYSFTDYLRGDLTFDYSEGDFNGATGPAVFSQNFEQYGFMANVYADLGTYAGFTPYVGAGAGITRVTWDTLALVRPFVLDTNLPGEENWRFTYALMAGVSYDITKDLKLDLGYRYSKVDGDAQFGYDTVTAAAGAVGVQSNDNGIEKHEIRAGLRYALW
ncbi:outer membrane protein [Hoeflea sp.]|uniref:outer membrane protein n=1 Tax=Hoeflea sp. TaxID=1940281 RepID=UPI003A8FD347